PLDLNPVDATGYRVYGYLLLEQINLITLVLLMIWFDEGPSIKALAGYQKKMEGCCHLMKM
ncbi:hypothetical protein DRU07_24555, partial [Salmonella enterica subsp. enterica]|nr:hypothetical protein [Salmonella enterica subsp. enterica serovar Typhimurium]ECB2988886.1 hypothetical protein [Salmonella enterica subsp. enterica serovar Typhimurium]HAF0027417.1 hypothetical protein [Salmonella enterica subsp. enterica serovar Typhimurium]